MSINKTVNYFRNLVTGTVKKPEIRLYEKYIAVLSDLKNKDLSENQLTSIEAALTELKLDANTGNRKKYLQKQFENFSKYLKKEFSFIIEGYYTTMGIALGVLFGTVCGSVFGSLFERSLGISLGISFGLLIGVVVGKYLDAEAEKQNRVLKTK